MDDIMCHTVLVLPFLHDFDVAKARVGAERNPLKKKVTYRVNDLDAAPEWKIGDVRSLAGASTVTAGSITLGVAVRSRQSIADQLLSKADVIRAMHERVQLCQDPQTEFALLRESLGVRGLGHTILEEQRAAAVYDEIGQRSLERLFPGLTEDSMTQATLSAGQSGFGSKSTGQRCSCTSGSSHRSQTKHPDAFWPAFSSSRSWRRVSLRSSRPPPPPISAHSTATNKQRQRCVFRRQPRRHTEPGSKPSQDCRDWVSQTLHLHLWETPPRLPRGGQR